MRSKLIAILLINSSLSLFGQTAVDSSITIVKQLEDIEIIQHRTGSFVEQQPEKMVVDMQQIRYMPKFLGTSDPIRYLQSLAGIQTNNETSTGIHVQGCDDYHTLVSLNDAPVFYPNHMLGLYSTFISPHFRTVTVEQAEHRATMANRIGGWVGFHTFANQPERFSMEGNIGIVNSDLTFTVPMGKRNALWVSARASYINWLYGRLLKFNDFNVQYDFQDVNLTYASQMTDKDRLVATAFYSHDKMGVKMDNGTVDLRFPWQNIVGSLYWNRHWGQSNWRTTVFYSSFDNQLNAVADSALVNTYQSIATTGIKNRFNHSFTDAIHLEASLDYEHYMSHPLDFQIEGISMFESATAASATQHADELSLAADMRHEVCPWFAYNAGLRAAGYIHRSRFYGALDPRVSFHFTPRPNHSLSLHYGLYHQFFHKSGLTGGGLPTDFFFLASEDYLPEWAHAVNLKYLGTFYHQQYSVSAEVYFKQIYNIAESTGNVLQVLNKQFSYDDYLVRGNGRNYGLNFMFQRNSGIVTGYVSYTLGWARRSLPELEGYTDYRYAASSERRHDLKIVINSHFAKRWNVSAMFVVASGLPYTEAKEAYFMNGKMICLYSTYNGAHMSPYHRLDLSCSCDIIKTKEHEFGINVSLYNTYAQKNAQFVVYRTDFKPIVGSTMSTIIPSISLYGKF